MSEKYYTKDHEWIKVDGDSFVVGITDFAQKQLGDVVFVELPERGTHFEKGDEVSVVESVKAASEVYAPLDGKITAVNIELENDPSLVNSDPEGEGWFFKVEAKNKSDINDLLSLDEYEKITGA